MTGIIKLFITCPKGLEYLLSDELASFGKALHGVGQIVVTKVHPAGVEIEADFRGACYISLWSRLANRVLMPLAETSKTDREGLYQSARNVEWQQYLREGDHYWIASFGQAGSIKHSGFGAQVVNDAIKDYFRDLDLEPPVINKANARQTLQLSIRNTISLSLDFAGRSLHQRGYRLEGEAAPLKENLAAAVLIRAGWPEFIRQGKPLLDPMCGSGTLVIEGAMMALDVAPGLHNPKFAFTNADTYPEEIWREVLAEAQSRAVLGKRRWQGHITGYDLNPVAVRSAKRNLARTGLDRWVEFRKGNATEIEPELSETSATETEAMSGGLVICNPPYGERLGQELELRGLYQSFGRQLKKAFGGWQAGIFTSNKFLAKKLGMRADKEYKLYNGKLPTTLFLFSVFGNRSEPQISAQPNERVFSEQAQMFANRLKKNLKRLKRTTEKQNLQAYRLYDADIPEYSVAVDCYGDCYCIQEYAPPKTVDEDKSRQRFLDVLEVVPQVLQATQSQVFAKQRKRQKGKEQYQRDKRQQKELVVVEHGCKFWVNLSDFLDTGLFLDHRPVRKYIQDHAQGKHFLNLFCYTASASVHAAIGGAASTTSVDLSNTYLNWARRNFELNKLKAGDGHLFEKANVMDWINRSEGQYDLVFLDPPTFSNSKSMENILDIQRDHKELLQKVMKLLVPGGLLIFSSNFRRFKLDEDLESAFAVEDKTDFSIPFDFARNKRIHQCWFFRHKRQD